MVSGVPLTTAQHHAVQTVGGMVVGQPIPFNLGHALFGFEGRMRRLHYGLIALVTGIIWVFLLSAWLFMLLGGGEELAEEAFIGGMATMCLLAIPAIWIAMATQIKRLHDMNRPGTYVLIGLVGGLVPFIGGLIALGYQLWLIFEDGTAGQNQFGADPKGRVSANPAGGFAQPMNPF